MLQCGMYEAVITPPLGNSLPGQADERKATGITADLMAKACVWEGARGAMAWIVIDALFVPASYAAAIRQRVTQFTGIQSVHIIVAATHTHTGPAVRPGFDSSYDSAYEAYVIARAADAAVMAYRNRQPVRVGWGEALETTICFQRRYWMSDGTVATNPRRGDPRIVRPAGPADSRIPLLRIDDAAGRPLGAVLNVANHPCTATGTSYDPDYPGIISRRMKQQFGESFVCLFMLGAAGNINHLDPLGMHTATTWTTEQVGNRLADAVLRAYPGIVVQQEQDMQIVQRMTRVALRQPTDEERAEAVQTAQSVNSPVKDRVRAQQLLAGLAETHREIEVQACRIGRGCMLALPGEWYVEFGLEAQQRSPFAHTMLTTLSNGSWYGYVCTEEAFRQGSYGTKLSPSRIPVGGGEQLLEVGLSLLQHLQQDL